MGAYLSYAEWYDRMGSGAVRTIPVSVQTTGMVEGAITESEQEVEQAVRTAGYSVVAGGLPVSETLKGIVFRAATWLKMGHVWADGNGTNAAIALREMADLRSGKTTLPDIELTTAGEVAAPAGLGVPIMEAPCARAAVMQGTHPGSWRSWPWLR